MPDKTRPRVLQLPSPFPEIKRMWDVFPVKEQTTEPRFRPGKKTKLIHSRKRNRAVHRGTQEGMGRVAEMGQLFSCTCTRRLHCLSPVLRSRVCYRWRGQRPTLASSYEGCPGPRVRVSLHLKMQWAASFSVPLWNADPKSAFLHGDPDSERPEPIFLRPWQGRTFLYKLSAPVYGQSNAPRPWFNHISRVLRTLQWEAHSLDPCLFLFRKQGNVVELSELHVDYLLLSCCLPGYEEALNQVEARFTWGSPWVKEDFTFVGRRIKQWPDGSIVWTRPPTSTRCPSPRSSCRTARYPASTRSW